MRVVIYFIFTFLFTTISCNTSVERSPQEETVDQVTIGKEKQDSSIFGAEVNASKIIKFSTILKEMEVQDSTHFTTRAQVVEVCQLKGCWMTLTTEDTKVISPIMVKFRDYAFFVPKDLSGKEVIVEGTAYRQITPVEELRHYAEDAGKSKQEIEKITEPKEEVIFIASGVKVL